MLSTSTLWYNGYRTEHICQNSFCYHLIAAHKQCLRQGNVFACERHSVHRGSLYELAYCLAAWSHVPSRAVSIPGPMFLLGVSVEGGLCPEGVSVGRPPRNRKMGPLLENFLVRQRSLRKLAQFSAICVRKPF